MFFKKYECGIASYADNTPHTYDSDLYTVLSKLKNCTDNLLRKIIRNHMVITTTSLLQLKNQYQH